MIYAAIVLAHFSFGVSQTPKIAIVGAGIGGAFAADRLRALHPLGDKLQIDVLEATERAGGRAMSFDIDGIVSLNLNGMGVLK